MASVPGEVTLTHPGTPRSGGSRPPSFWALPPDLLAEAVRRLRAVALLHAIGFLLAGPLVSLLTPQGRALLVGSPLMWAPAALSITAALVVAALTLRPELSAGAKLRIGLAFEELGSVCIAVAEYHHVSAPIMHGALGPGGFGLSWVAVWVLLFSVVVPAPPAVTLLFAAFSLAAVPLVYAVGQATASNVPLEGMHFFFALVFPNLIVLLMAYVGSRVVYRLGAAVREAREMGSYRLVQRLGTGGMGEVWRAQHRTLVRPAAIKLIRPEVLGVQDPASRHVLLQRFEREAQATALMRSPHTLELYDFGVTDDGTFYHVMELLDGLDLSDLVHEFGPQPPARVVHLLGQVCHSLAEAHEAGLIHRDVKPANIHVCRYGREVDFVKVLDFGLVKRGGSDDRLGEQLTQDQMAGGTPAFMSPEQALGETEVDGRSDLYALGCVAYWLLTGTPVFKGRTVMETLVMHVNAEPEPPSRRAPEPLPAELDALVLACLAKDPADRPQTADELARRLTEVPLASRWTPERAREWWDRHRPATEAVAAAT